VVNIVSPPTVPARYDTLTSPGGILLDLGSVSSRAQSAASGQDQSAVSRIIRTAMGSARLENLWRSTASIGHTSRTGTDAARSRDLRLCDASQAAVTGVASFGTKRSSVQIRPRRPR
jgi:hypothetical protein